MGNVVSIRFELAHVTLVKKREKTWVGYGEKRGVKEKDITKKPTDLLRSKLKSR